MAQAAVTTLSSVGVSNPVATDWIGSKPVTAVITMSSSTVAVDFTVQFTLDSVQSSSSPTWLTVASSVGGTATHFSNSNFDTGAVIGFGYPIAGLRISSSANGGGSTLTMKVLQGVGG